MKEPCCICGKSTGSSAHRIRLTDTEKTTIRNLGQNPPDVFVYCRPCMAVISNREAGAQLMKGVLQAKLRAAGVVDAERRAQMYYDFCIKNSTSKPVS